MGDSLDLAGVGNGLFAFNAVFSLLQNTVAIYSEEIDPGYYQTSSSIVITSLLPSADQVLAIRFYDSEAGSGLYNTVSADTWLWKVPSSTPTVVTIDLADSLMEWQDPSNPFRTTIAVPEPTVLSMFGIIVGAGTILRLARGTKRSSTS